MNYGLWMHVYYFFMEFNTKLEMVNYVRSLFALPGCYACPRANARVGSSLCFYSVQNMAPPGLSLMGI